MLLLEVQAPLAYDILISLRILAPSESPKLSSSYLLALTEHGKSAPSQLCEHLPRKALLKTVLSACFVFDMVLEFLLLLSANTVILTVS